jgi:inorganic pyrophosphatase
MNKINHVSGEYWSHLDTLIASSQVAIDRPKGSRHPRYPNLIYPLDYGYLEGTTTVDGGGVDVWVGSRAEKSLDAILCSVDLFKKDAEVKLLLGCNEAEKQIILDLVNNSEAMRAMLVLREAQA